MNTYTIEFTKLGSIHTWSRAVEADSFQSAAEKAESDFLKRGKYGVSIALGDRTESKLTTAFAEELLYEMDAKNLDKIEVKDDAGRATYTRSQVESSLFSDKHSFRQALKGKLDS